MNDFKNSEKTATFPKENHLLDGIGLRVFVREKNNLK